jgi:hypothetical protein
MARFCGELSIGAVQGGGTVGSQTVRGNRVVTSFEVPVAIEYQMSVGSESFRKIRCCEQAMAPFVAQNNGNRICIYTFKQMPRTIVMLAVVSKDGPSYRMGAGRFWATLITHGVFVPLVLAVILLLIPGIGWLLIPVLLYFTTRNALELWRSWHQMQSDGGAVDG